VQLKPLEVDDVDVGGFSNLKRAAVPQPVQTDSLRLIASFCA
jgi:hypothetical protein